MCMKQKTQKTPKETNRKTKQKQSKLKNKHTPKKIKK